MGVPKFYRWLSERYPCLSQVIKEHQIPEFDNLYLDMNGIIHPCSHPNDNDVHFRITDVTIFKNIFNYIEVLFRIIKPKKNFFMAVDGCAPRAKMNQQRSRRFRTAKDAEDNIRKALMNGHKLPTTDRFDSNCITPGTEFMVKLQEQLMYFVNKKISTDPLWQNCNIYLSGHNVPGEGEHKIMDFIRYCKSQPGYDVNTRHCLYGLDADLIILGMVTHEPHFALLREEVRYGRDANKSMVQPEEQTFHLLHLSLLREYLDFEFQALKPDLHFLYNLERIIDDWVILGFLVGNDFVPHLPHLHINSDAFPYLFGIYKEFLVTADGYLNDGGYLNIHRLKKFFEVLSKFDRSHFQDIYAELKWLESKGAGNMLHKDKEQGKTPTKRFSELLKLSSQSDDSPMRSINPYNISGLDELCLSPSPEKPSKVVPRVPTDNDEDVEVEDEETFELEFKQHKRHYYMEKFDMDIVEDDQIHTICFEYVRALQWIAHYYFNGLQSWSWYYPYHYSPHISDVAALEAREIEFDMAKPFLPFEQLLAVLPAASRKLLPDAFQTLMIEENSPIIDFYPPNFQTDLNGKKQDWEAVVLIPFINETRLLNAMAPNYPRLTDEEKERNSFGDCYKYTYNKNLNFNYPTSYFGIFDDINVCKAEVEIINRDLYRLDPLQIKKGLSKGTLLDTYYHGFPTMKHLELKAYLKKAGVKVFQQNSRNDNMVIKIISPPQQNMETLANQLVGESVFVEWPYMVEAMVTSICNDSTRYYLHEKEEKELVSKLIKGDEYNNVKGEMRRVGSELMLRRGVELGTVEILVEAKLLLGQRYICETNGSVRLEKEWKLTPNLYAYQTVVQNLPVFSSDVEVYDSIAKLYPPGSLVFMMSSAHYGCSGEVIETVEADMNVRVRVMLKVIPEPDFGEIIHNYGSLSVHYIPDRTIAQRLGISTNLLGRITGNLHVVPEGMGDMVKSQNIGLKLKYSGQNKEVLGFARRTENGWTYSPITIGILNEYMNRFPDVFENLGRIPNQEQYRLSLLLPGKSNSYLDEILAFLHSQKCHNVQPVRCGSNILDHPIVDEILNAVEKAKNMVGEKKVVKVKAKPHLLFRPTEKFGTISADPGTEFLLFDRVVNIQYGIAVPIGLRGTIIGFHDVPTEENNKESPTEIRYEILFDESFLADKGESLKRGYLMSGHSLLNISYGLRMENKKNGNPLSSPSSFQNKISHAPVAINTSNSSPYGARTPGSNNPQASPRYGQQSPYGNSQSTPKYVQHSPYGGNSSSSPRYGGQQGACNNSPSPAKYNQSTSLYGNQRGNHSSPSNKSHSKSNALVSPEQWLKGQPGKNNSYTPQPQPRRQILQHSPGNQQHSGGNQQYSGGNQQYSGGNQQHSGGNQQDSAQKRYYQQGIDDNDFINMWSELQKNENATIKNSPAGNQEETIDKDATAMIHQMLKMKDQNSTQSTTAITQSPLQHNASKHNPSPQGLSQQASLLTSPNLQTLPASPHTNTKSFQTSPLTSNQHASMGSQHASQYSNNRDQQKSLYSNNQRPPLLNYIPQQNTRSALTSMSPSPGYFPNMQGTYSLFGIPQNNASSASQSTIFQQLCGGAASMPNQQYPYNVMPQTQVVSPISQGVAPLNFRISPLQMGHHVSSYQFPSPMMQTRDLYQTPQSFYSPRPGFQSPHQFTPNSRSNTNFSNHLKQSNSQVRQSLLGTPANEKQKTKPNMFIPHQVLMKNSSLRPTDVDDEKTKDITCDEKPPNPNNEYVNSLFDAKPLSDDDKIKSLIGINTTSGKTIGDGSCRKRDIDPNQVKCPEDASCNTSLYNPTPIRPSEAQTISNVPTPTPLVGAISSAGGVGSQTVDGSGSQNKKPQILLAPSFFGPKKKSL